MGDGVRDGGCRCGQVRFRLTGPELLTMACHCKGCQRMSGGAYSVSIAMPTGGFQVTAGEPMIGGMHGDIQHNHCPYCLSWVFTRLPGIPMVNVRATMLDDTAGYVPYVETCTAEMLPWATVPAVESFPGFPPDDRWPVMIAAYARRGGG